MSAQEKLDKSVEEVGVRLLANDHNDPRHEDAIGKYATVLAGCVRGFMSLAELKNVETGELEYFIVGVMKLEADGGEKYHYLPVAKLFVEDQEAASYMLPDLEGGWVGEDVEDAEPDSQSIN